VAAPRIPSVERQSADLADERIDRLADLFPEAVTEGKIDFDKLRQSLGEIVDDRPERYSFAWAGKRDAIRLLRVPSRATLKPCPKESMDWETTKNIFIEGENLEVLKLLYKSYAGRVKMIYIDPPYNTGNDFIYPDDFADPLDTYLKLTGQKNAEGNLLTSNPETSGRYHSTWLSMMYPRIFVARQLLRDDGLICVSIDDTELHNLRLLMNEIFGEENCVATIVWKNVYGGGAKSKHVVPQHEYILIFGRDISRLGVLELPPDPEARKRYTEKDDQFRTRGPYFTQPLATTSMDDRPNLRFPILWKEEEIWPEKQWQWSRKRVEEALENGELVMRREKGKWSVRYKQYLRDETGRERPSKLFSILRGPWTQKGTAEIAEFFGDGKVFPFPKPSLLISHLVSCCWKDEKPIVLDFFAGSCSTAQAVLDLNRRHGGDCTFICTQLQEPVPDGSAALKAGFRTIANIGKERIRRVIKKLKKKKAEGHQDLFKDRETPEDLGFRVFTLTESNYRQWRGVEEKDGERYTEEMSLFTDPLLPGWRMEDVIWEVALKEGYGLSSTVEELKEIKDNRVWQVNDPDRGQSFRICLDGELKDTTVKTLRLAKEDLLVCRDSALADERAANLALTCRLKTI
jgi:adenine-specific DNA-methyltransferase